MPTIDYEVSTEIEEHTGLEAEFIRQLGERIHDMKDCGNPFEQFDSFVDIAYHCDPDLYPGQYAELFQFWLFSKARSATTGEKL